MASLFISHSAEDRQEVKRLMERLNRWGYESLFAFFDRQEGVRGGQRWQEDLYRRLRTAEAVIFVGTRASTQSRWCFAELTLAQSARKPIFPIAIEPGVRLDLLADVQWLDVSDGEEAYERLRLALRDRLHARGAFLWDPARAPYPGLAPFEAQDAAMFFGREDAVEDIIGRLDATLGRGRCIAVIGASGSGKSSLVRAGVIPRLQRQADRWMVLPVFTPGERPLTAAARAVTTALRALGQAHDRSDVERRMGGDPADFAEVLRDLVANNDAASRSVLMTVDQAEELILLATKPERDRFFTLLRAALGSGAPLWVLATLRSEFLSASLRDEGLVDVIDEPVLLPPLGRSRFAEVILGPAAKAGLEFAPGVADRMVEDTTGGDALPLLAYTLRELYDRRHAEEPIAGGDYEAIGGVLGALRRRADLVAQDLDRRGYGEEVLPTLLQLVTIDAEGQPARRRVASAALSPGQREVVRSFIDARLLVSDQGDAEGTLEVAHEALLREWAPLHDAIVAVQDRLRLERELERDADEWIREGRRDGYLLRGERLARARQILNVATAPSLFPADATISAFYRASEALEQREQETVARRRQRIIVGLSVGLVLISTAAIAFYWQYQQAQQQTRVAQRESRVADSRRLATTVLANLEQDPDHAALLGLEAYRISPTFEARNALLTVLPRIERITGALRGHTDSVSGVAFSRDDHTIASAGGDGTVRLWDALTHKAVGAPLRGHTDFVTSVAFSPNGHIIASAGEDRTVRVWDTGTHKPLGSPLRGHTDAVTSVAFSPNGHIIASAGADATVRLWHTRTHKPLGSPLRGHTDAVTSVAFSPNGHIIASAGEDRTVRVWDTGTHKPLGSPLRGHTDAVTSVAFSPNGHIIASAGADATVRLWHTRTHKPLGSPLRGHTKPVQDVVFSPGGHMIASAGADATVRLWDTRTRKPLGSPLRGHTDIVDDVAFSAHGYTVASAGWDGTVRLWDSRVRRGFGSALRGHTGEVNAVAFKFDSRTIASASEDRTVRVWDTGTHKPLGSPLRGHTDNVDAVTFSPGGQTIASAGWDGTVRLWDARTREPRGSPLRGHTDAVTSVAFSPNGHIMATSGEDRTVRLWDTGTHKPLGSPLRGHTGIIDVVAFSPDGQTIASASWDGTVRLWDARTHKPLGSPLRGHTGPVLGVAFPPDGHTIASAGWDGTVRLWDARTHKPLGSPLRGHTGAVNGVAFSADGHTIATGGEDRTVRLWDARTHRSLGSPLRGHTGAVTSVAFSPDGRTLASTGQDGTVRLWDAVLWTASWRSLAKWVCRRLERSLTHSEWRDAIPALTYRETCTSS